MKLKVLKPTKCNKNILLKITSHDSNYSWLVIFIVLINNLIYSFIKQNILSKKINYCNITNLQIQLFCETKYY